MKRKSMPIAVLVLAVMVALGGLGLVYAKYTAIPLAVTGNVTTANFAVALSAGTITPGNLVACTATPSADAHTLTITASNMSPGNGCTVGVTATNLSSIPVTLDTPMAANGFPAWLSPSAALTPLALNAGDTATGTFYLLASTPLDGLPTTQTGSVTWNFSATQAN